ncbi:MAG: cyclohexanecarboxyl-CoA dehydrogenase [Streptosporangiales bacterium]|nr:cyclohexanecarboxyl-CoA dehydrogenase [Streptosporangiales bacterium]
MIDFTPTPEQAMLVEMVRRFVQEEIVPIEHELDPDAGRLPPEKDKELRAKVAQMGLTNWDAPAEVGGPGLDVVTQTLLAMEMSQHRAGLYTTCYGVFGGAGLAHLYEASDYLKERYLYPTLRGEMVGCFALSEPSGGSDPARAVQTRAVRDGEDWVINGSKLWISEAANADYAILIARTGDEGRDGLTAFVVETAAAGFTVRREVPVLRKVHKPTELTFDDVRVPDRNRVSPEGAGFRMAAERLAMRRIPYAAECVGTATAAHRMATEYAKIREVFGKPLAQQQGIQWMLVDNEIDIRTARMFVLDAAVKADRGEPFRTEAALAKLAASEGGFRVVDRCVQIHGGLGVAADLPLERWFREMRIRRIGEGPTEVQRMLIARDLLGKHASASRRSA